MAYKNIYEVLEQYGYSESKKEEFIKEIDKFKDEINHRDEAGITPIAYYCSTHLHSGVSREVLEILILKFGANVNIPHANLGIPYADLDIPLSILLKQSDNNISAIKLLVQKTKSYLLVKKRNNNSALFAQIVTNPKILNDKEVIELYNGIKYRISNRYDDDDKEKLYEDLENVLIDFSQTKDLEEANKGHIKAVVDILKDIDSDRFYKVEGLLIKSIAKKI